MNLLVLHQGHNNIGLELLQYKNERWVILDQIGVKITHWYFLELLNWAATARNSSFLLVDYMKA